MHTRVKKRSRVQSATPFSPRDRKIQNEIKSLKNPFQTQSLNQWASQPVSQPIRWTVSQAGSRQSVEQSERQSAGQCLNARWKKGAFDALIPTRTRRPFHRSWYESPASTELDSRLKYRAGHKQSFPVAQWFWRRNITQLCIRPRRFGICVWIKQTPLKGRAPLI